MLTCRALPKKTTNTMYQITCEEHGVDHTTETEQAAYKHVNVHKEVHTGCQHIKYEEIETEE